MSRLVHASCALDLCAQAMDHGCNSEAERDDVRAIYSVAGQMLAADQVARASIQTDPRIAIPDWLTDLVDQQQHPTEEGGGGPADWCGECGLELAPGTPPSVWTGHVHKPTPRGIMEAAANLWAVAKAIALDTGDEGAIKALRPRLDAVGVTEQAAQMFLRLTAPSSTEEGS